MEQTQKPKAKSQKLRANRQSPKEMPMRRWITIAAFLAAALLGLFALPLSSGAQPQPPATLFPPGVVTIQLTPTAAPTRSPREGCYPPLPFGIGDQIGVRGGVNFRNLPTVSGAVVNYFDLPVAVYITEGPVCADGLNWWRIRGVGTPGWVAEGTPDFYYLNLLIDADNPEPCANPQEIAVGERVRLLNGVRVHEEANLDALVITVATAGSLLPVVGGPVCDGGLNFWQVEAPYGNSDTTITGWVSEGYDYDYLLEPELRPLYTVAECLPPLIFAPNERAVVLNTGGIVRSLRSAPSERAPLVATLVGGIQLTVLEGPVCRDNLNWWRVQVYGGSDDPIGWLAEGTPQDRFFDRLPVATQRPPR
jgi:hypothetical protein